MESMTTALKPAEKILAYDGDCPMCTTTVAMLIRMKLVRPDQTRANYDLTGADLEAAQAAGIRNQLVVLDSQTHETRSGTDGLLWILRENTGNHFLVRLLTLPGIRQALRWGYQVISYNRRIVSVPRHQIVCDCEPEVTLGRRLSLVVPLLLLTIFFTAAFGAAVFSGWQLGDALAGAGFMEVALGTFWVALVVASAVLLAADKRVDYLAHLAATMFVGALVLVPASLLTPLLPRQALVALNCATVLASVALMFSMQRRRIAALGLSRGWLWAWVAVLTVGFGVTTWLYFGQA
jgi:predicted DCC family thiol-disulfide oxidoreductase YuxK